MNRLFFIAALAAVACLSTGCGRGPDEASPGSEERTTPSASDHRVMGVQGLPPGWSKATVTGEPTTGTGVSAEGGAFTGTAEDDLIVAGRGEQTVRGLGGGDALSGGGGRDTLHGGPGDDLINAQGDGKRDKIDCGPGPGPGPGPGRDEVRWDAGDGERPRRCEFKTVSVE